MQATGELAGPCSTTKFTAWYGGAFQKSLPALPRLSLKSPHVAENWAHSKPVLGDLKGAIRRLLARCPTNLRGSPPIRPPNKGRRRLLKRTSVTSQRLAGHVSSSVRCEVHAVKSYSISPRRSYFIPLDYLFIWYKQINYRNRQTVVCLLASLHVNRSSKHDSKVTRPKQGFKRSNKNNNQLF